MYQNACDSLSAFLTDAGVDVVFNPRDPSQFQQRTRLSYDTMRGKLNGKSVEVKLVDGTDDRLVVSYGSNDVLLKQQPKGHFFGPIYDVQPSEAVDMGTVRERIAAARKQSPAGNNGKAPNKRT